MAIPIVMPRLNWSQETGVVTRWLRAPGEYVKAGEPLMMIETEKAEVEVEADDSGYLHPLAVLSVTLPVATVVGYLLSEGESPPEEVASDTLADKGESSTERPGPSRAALIGKGGATPVARRVAKEHGIDLAEIQGSARDGTITERDVLAYVEQRRNETRQLGQRQRVQGETAGGLGVSPANEQGARAKTIPLNAIRRATAQRLAASFSTAPHFYLRVTVDMLEAESSRKAIDPQPSVTAVAVRAASLVLVAHPEVNCAYSDGGVVMNSHVNIGVAVSTSEGLLVPVIHDADKLNLAEIDQRLRELRQRAEERRFRANELSGGTFTVSNLGMFGVESFLAVINPPEAAILAIGALCERPYRGKDNVEFHPSMELALSIDHRALDGAEGARFLADLKRVLEQPSILF